MNIIISEIKSIQDVDFQSLFEGSFPDIDINYYIKDIEKGYSDIKRDTYLNNLIATLSGERTPINHSVLGFKATIDGTDHLLNIGFIDNTGTYKSIWMLSKPYQTNRAFIYSEEYISLRNNFLKSKGVVYYCVKTVKDSLLYKSLKRSNSIGTIKIKEEITGYVGSGKDIQTVDVIFSL